MHSYDVVIVGGGIIGGAIAFGLAEQRLRVALLDRGDPGREASWAAAGMLTPGPDSTAAIPLVPFARASLGLYPNWLAALERASGLRVPLRRDGAIELLFSADAERELSTLVTLHRGLGLATEPLPVDEARRLEPAISRETRAAAFMPYEATVEPRALARAVFAAAAGSRVAIIPGAEVTQFLREGSRCTGLIARQSGADQTYSAGHVVLAAGAFCAKIAGLAPPVPTRPVRGQMAALRSSAPPLRRVVRSERGYIVPRDDAPVQRLVTGSTLEDAGFEKRVTPRGLEQIFSAAQELVPALAGSEIVETWSGLRPDTPDHLPLLGPSALEDLTIATGHYRNGILLTPITSKLVCEWITQRRVSMDWQIFDPLRFATSDPDADGGAIAASRAAQ